jgi:hypothetical protein
MQVRCDIPKCPGLDPQGEQLTLLGATTFAYLPQLSVLTVHPALQPWLG